MILGFFTYKTNGRFISEHSHPQCKLNCFERFEPICAQNGNGTTKVFNNYCQLRVAICNSPMQVWSEVDLNVCDGEFTCHTWCSTKVQPICAVNRFGRYYLFGNKCLLRHKQCLSPELGYHSFLRSSCQTGDGNVNLCAQFCDVRENEIFGSNIQETRYTFVNKCELEFLQCEEPLSLWGFERL